MQLFAFRVDAGLHIGTGHVMRCLTLADHLVYGGKRATFLTRPHDGHMIEMIRGRGHDVKILPSPKSSDYGYHPARPVYASWLRGSWREDAEATHRWACEAQPDWLVVDHYALDASWQEVALPTGIPLLVIDDLADRPHRANLLIDQNAGRKAADYDGLVPKECTRLIGPLYAILRPEFAARRSEALARRQAARIHNILITLGGIDENNLTLGILDSLDRMELPPEVSLTVILGSNSPWTKEVRDRAELMAQEVEVITGANNMAELMVTADLCIGASGSTAWERCALGLPTLLVVMAENQRNAADTLIAYGAAIRYSSVQGLEDATDAGISYISSPSVYRSVSASSARLVDAEGTNRVATYIAAFDIGLRVASASDGEFIWNCRNDGEAWRNYRNAAPTSMTAHLDWFEKALTSPTMIMTVVSLKKQDIGTVRLDIDATGRHAEIGVSLAQAARGFGLGSAVIARTVQKSRDIGLCKIFAHVRPENIASHRAFKRSGFKAIGKENGMIVLCYNL